MCVLNQWMILKLPRGTRGEMIVEAVSRVYLACECLIDGVERS